MNFITRLIKRMRIDFFSVRSVDLFSEEAREARALAVAARFSSNANARAGSILTPREFKKRMDEYQRKVEKGKFFFSR